ncbi:MAG: hypothetical protein HQ579_06215 [Candidatus Omnitrophica bacterium]|nr:hypothetical protein [Candidatus Omnitrophota bacterium]
MPRLMSGWIQRIPKHIEIYSIIKQFILQIITFFDAMVGPSMWLKIYYAFTQLRWPSIAAGIIITGVFYAVYKDSENRYNKKLILTFTLLTFLSFGMFAITGMYPQMAFNLGNRVTIFGSLLMAYLIALIPVGHKWRTLIFSVLIFCILGISDHWKAWNLEQQKVIFNMKNNKDLVNYSGSEIIYISGNQYSQYGPLSHIEFLSESWVPRSICSILFDKGRAVASLNRRHLYKNGYLLDAKYNRKARVDDCIYVYDSENNILIKVESEKINSYIESLPPDNRHWIQLLNIKVIKVLILRLMPRLKYAL